MVITLLCMSRALFLQCCLGLLLLLYHGSAKLQQQPLPPAIKNLHWLIGHWERISMKEGSSGYEQWQKSGDNELSGRGVTMEAGDTVLIEKIRLLEKNNAIYYVADV